MLTAWSGLHRKIVSKNLQLSNLECLHPSPPTLYTCKYVYMYVVCLYISCSSKTHVHRCVACFSFVMNRCIYFYCFIYKLLHLHLAQFFLYYYTPFSYLSFSSFFFSFRVFFFWVLIDGIVNKNTYSYSR